MILDYEIIFYHARMTAENETALTKALTPFSLNQSGALAATTPKELAKELSLSLSRVKLVFVVGGLDGGEQSTEKILSKVLSGKKASLTSNKIILEESVEDGYIIRCMDQTVLVLPDDSNSIEAMMSKAVSGELAKIYKLKKREEEARPDIEQISEKLDTQLSDTARTRVGSPVVTVLAEEIYERPRSAKLAISILLLLSGVELLAALILYLIFYL